MSVINLDTINVRFNGDATGVKKAATDAKTALDDFSKGAKDSGKAAKSTGEKMKDFGDRMSKTFESVRKQINQIRAVTSAVKKVGSTLYETFKTSNDYIESVNLAATTLGNHFEEARKKATEFEQNAGINSSEWLTYVGTLQSMTEGFGHASDNAYLMSTNLTALAYDLASLYNQDVETTFNKIESAMTGQIKGIREYGVNLTMAALGEYARAHGIELSTAKMTEAQKATLRYNMILEHTKHAQGDLARTLVSPANSIRIMSNQWEVLKRHVGQVVSIIATKLIPYLQLAIQLVDKLVSYLSAKFGFEMPEIDYSSLGNLGSSDLATDTEEAADNLDDANENAKKLKRTLLGFDEINKLQDVTESAKNATIPYGGGMDELMGLNLNDYFGDFSDQLNSMAEKTLDKLKQTISTKLANFLIVAGAIAAALGVVLMFTGFWVAGVTLFLTGMGMIGLGVGIKWMSYDGDVKRLLDAIGDAAMLALLALGVILLLTGHLAIGIGLIVADAVIASYKLASEWKDFSPEVRQTLAKVLEVAIAMMLVLGVILVCLGQLGLGVGLIVGGIALLAISMAVSWNAHDAEFKKSLMDTLSYIGAAISVIGIILILTGHLPLGIGMVIGGIALFGATASLNWNAHDEDYKRSLSITLAAIGFLVMVIGIAFIATATGLATGLALVAFGAASLVGSVVVAWNSYDESIRQSLSKMLATIGVLVLVVGIVFIVTGVGLPLGLAMIAFGAASLFGSAVLAWNSADSSIKESLGKTFKIIGGALMAAVGLLLTCAGFFLLGIPLIYKGGLTVWKETDGSDNKLLNWVHEKLTSIGNSLSSWWTGVTDWDWSISFTANLSHVWESVVDLYNTVVDWFGNLNFGGWFGGSISGYATGGTPASGEIFLSRENGMPELVGRVGHQTTVMNNGQIVDAVAEGVADAVAEAMIAVIGNSGGASYSEQNGEFVFYDVNEEVLARAVRRGNERISRRMSPQGV